MWEILIPIVGKLFDKILPDTEAANAAKAKLLELQLNGELQQIIGQLDINKAEAGSSSMFVAGWRPFVGWICGMGLGYVAILEPVMRFLAQVMFNYTGKFPVIDTTLTMQVLLGMLGMGALRSFDKKNGTESK